MRFTVLTTALTISALCHAQGTFADYERAQKLQSATRGLVVNTPGTPNWIDESNRFWYTKSVKCGTEFVLVDAATSTKKPAFDHEKLAAAINSASGGHYTGVTLPFAPAPGARGGGGSSTPSSALTSGTYGTAKRPSSSASASGAFPPRPRPAAGVAGIGPPFVHL